MKIVTIFLLLFIFVANSVISQNSIQTVPTASGCGSESFIEMLRKDPAYVKQEQMQNLELRKKTLARKNLLIQNKVTSVNDSKLIILNAPPPAALIDITIPIVFHIVNDNPDAITDQMIYDALVQLNDAYAHRNVYASDPKGVDTHIQFCMAKKNPTGGKTNGIDRIKSYYQNVDVDLEAAQLPKLSDWDPSKYANVWLVNSIQGEIPPSTFDCGKWTRTGYGGYASAGAGAVVSSLAAPLVAHELGHYLSLLHTFTGMNCLNNDCTTNGDQVCDTPPDRTNKPGSCSPAENTCNTDTISGPFVTDVPDNVTNFMDYTSCASMFTLGQAQRMQDFISIFSGGSLLTSDACSEPCADNIQASFNWNSNPYPIIGSNVDFTNTSSGSSDYEWYLNGTLKTNTTDFDESFPSAGTYTVKLMAYNSTRSCYASYTGNVIVNCGVDARFSPNKRIVASSKGIYQDTVTFANTSYNADTYQWYQSDKNGSNFSMVSTGKDYLNSFADFGVYKIYLIASKGACVSTSNTYSLQVNDPRQDAGISIWAVNCYKNDSIKVSFTVHNYGYDTIPKGTSVRFHDQIPYNKLMPTLQNTFYTTNDILGKCDQSYTTIIATSSPQLDSLSAFVNEDNPSVESNNFNNGTDYKNFRLKYKVQPSNDTTVFINDLINIKITAKGEPINSIQWFTNGALSCTSCLNPSLTITDTTNIKSIVKTNFDCFDSTFTRINIFPIDISIANTRIDCYQNDSVLVTSTICLGNHYTAFKKPTEILYYDAIDSLGIGTHLIGSFTLPNTTLFTNSCTTIEQVIKRPANSLIAYTINNNQSQFEKNVTNNQASANYTNFRISSNIHSIDLYRKEEKLIQVDHEGDSITYLKWTPSIGLSCDTCLNTLLNVNASTSYKLRASTKYECVDSVDVNVNVYFQKTLALPNVFTPNGDGLNDHFYVIAGKDVDKVKSLVIFNRWGRKVFEKNNILPNDYYSGWDGTTNGKNAEMGTYVYTVVLEFRDGSSKTYNGTISLIR
jgi:gliding motility-associated-like protein